MIYWKIFTYEMDGFMEEKKLEMFSVSFGLGGLNFLELVVSTVNWSFAQIRGMNFQGFAVCHTSLLFFWLFFSISCQGLKNDGIRNIVF